MARPLRVLVILCFFTAIASNCIQASQISFDPIASLVTLLDGSPESEQKNELSFLITDDDSDDSDHPMPAETEIDGTQPLRFSPSYTEVVVTAIQIKSHTVLRL